jgi:hypothetical protein
MTREAGGGRLSVRFRCVSEEAAATRMRTVGMPNAKEVGVRKREMCDGRMAKVFTSPQLGR